MIQEVEGATTVNPDVVIIPLVLAGGAGTRLWPLSRGKSPKQFLRLGDDGTLLHQTLSRCSGRIFASVPIIVGAEDNRSQLLSVTQDLGLKADLILEPLRRNSCAAIVAGTLQALQRDEDAVVLMLAADHHIPDLAAFQSAIKQALAVAVEGQFVTFGIIPHHAATGYGYILPETSSAQSRVRRVSRFIEKPDAATAERYVSEGYLWNSGNFLFKAKVLIEEVRKYAPDVLYAVELSLKFAKRDNDYIRLSHAHFAQSPNISIDHAVLENTQKACVLPVAYEWSDIGTWDAVMQTLSKDQYGNSIIGRGVIKIGSNVAIHSEVILTTVIGCDDIIVIATQDAVLVVKKGCTESVKSLVEYLQAKGITEANSPLRQVDLSPTN